MTNKLIAFEHNGAHLPCYQLIDLRYLSGVLELTLLAVNKIKVAFEWVYSFRITDEGDLLKMQDLYNGQMVTGVYTVDSSDYISWFNEQSANIHSDEPITHYLIVTDNDVIEVLATVNPTIAVC